VIALFIQSPEIETLPIRIYSELEFSTSPAILIPVNLVQSQDGQWQAILPNGHKIPIPPPETKKPENIGLC
jgi:hypothetical protein